MQKYMPPVFKQTLQDQLELKQGGGCIGCFGVPFFLAGLFVFLMSIQIIHVSNATEVPWWAWIVMGVMGIVFTGVGAGLIWGRNWISIDRRQMTVWIAWGLLRPMKGTQYKLENYHAVVIQYNAGDSDTAESYPISLAAENGSDLSLFSPNTYKDSLQQAMLLSQFLDIPLKDMTTDHVLEIEATGRKKEEESEEPVMEPIRPQVLKCDVREDDTGLHIGIPMKSVTVVHVFGSLIPVIIIILIGKGFLEFFTSSHTPLHVQYFFGGFVLLFFVVLPLLRLVKALSTSRVNAVEIDVDEEGMTVMNRYGSSKKPVRVLAGDILDIDYSTRESSLDAAMDRNNGSPYLPSGGVSTTRSGFPWWISMIKSMATSKGITVKSTHDIITFGQGLPDDEVTYLYSMISKYMKGEA